LMVGQILAGDAITITDPAMTRFMMTLDDALDLVLYAFEHATNGDIFVQKAPAATIETLAKSLKALLGKNDHSISVIGTRHGEKLYEVLLSREEMASAEDHGDYFRVVPDHRGLNYKTLVNPRSRRVSNTTHTTRLDSM
jgi:UDP-N-acetylglucosamine 4,6-dehydratase